jgi:uncharacterized protein YdhG (YjbR/CyaY superfamily)
MRSTATSIDEYIAEFPPATQKLLRQMRDLIRHVAPEAVEAISYAIPTFDLHGRHLVHFAGFKSHVGFYPMASGVEHFQAELAGYKSAKGSVQFPFDRPLPLDLVQRIVEFRVGEVEARYGKGKRAARETGASDSVDKEEDHPALAL